MTPVSKTKWILSIILGGILLVLGLAGGSWQITYAADGAAVNADPIINFIYPNKVPAGSDNVMMVIAGENFGYVEDFIRVWVQDQTYNYTITPVNVIDTGIGVIITDTLLVSPNLYTIRVVKSNGQSIPTIPPNPIYDQVSNAVDFLVYQPRYIFMPLITKIH